MIKHWKMQIICNLGNTKLVLLQWITNFSRKDLLVVLYYNLYITYKVTLLQSTIKLTNLTEKLNWRFMTKVYKNIFSMYLILWKYIFVYFVYQRPNWLAGFVIKNLQIQDLGYMWQKTVKVRNLMVLFMKKKFKVNISQSQGCKSNKEKIY